MIIDEKYRICIIGNKNVGKSTLIAKFSKDPIYNTRGTIGVDFKSVIVQNKDKCCKLLLWEVSGDPLYYGIGTPYFLLSEIILIVVNTEDKKSLNSIRNWYEDIKYAKVNPTVQIYVLILNYINEVIEVDKSLNLPVLEIKTDNDIENIFQQIITETKAQIGEKENIEKETIHCKICNIL